MEFTRIEPITTLHGGKKREKKSYYYICYILQITNDSAVKMENIVQ